MKTTFLLSLFFVSLIAHGQMDEEKRARDQIIIEAKKTPEYKKAYIDVNEIRGYIKLAKNGTLKASDVINDYNRRLGPVMGKYKTLYSIDKRLKESGDAYIEMVLYKMSARIALDKASEM